MLTTCFPRQAAILIILAMLSTTLMAEEHTPDAERGQYRPQGFTGKLTPYSLKKVFRQERSKAREAKPSNYSTTLVKEFSEHYYPKVSFQWHTAGYHTAGGKHRNVGIRKLDENNIQEVFLKWQSFGDSTQRGFFNAEIERTTRIDPFAIVADAGVAKAIKRSLQERNLIGNHMDVTDVFIYRTRFFLTGTETSGVSFPEKDFDELQYGVSVGDQVYFFTTQGEGIEK